MSIPSVSYASYRSFFDNHNTKMVQSTQTNKNPNGYIMKNGKMIGIKVKKSENILLLCNKYETTTPTVNFEYLNACQQTKRIDSLPLNSFLSLNDLHTKPPKLRYRVSTTVWEYNSVKNALLNAGLQRTKTNNWNILWSKHLTIDELRQLHPAQKANHFPGSSIMGRKDLLDSLMRKCQRRHGVNTYNFIPKSFRMPDDYDAFQSLCALNKQILKKLKHQNTHSNITNYSQLQLQPIKKKQKQIEIIAPIWLIKPFSSSCGRGIKLVTDCYSIGRNSNVLVQEYLARPYLIDGRKFDLRLYCVVTSFDPLIIYLFHDGLVRFSTKKYSVSPKSIYDKQIHLTNYSIQKKYNAYAQNVDGCGEKSKQKKHCLFKESKWTLQQLWTYLEEEKDVDTEGVMENIHDVLIKTLIGSSSNIIGRLKKANVAWDQCFEIYGFDILLDYKLQPWLLEINLLPSLSSSSPLDKRIKTTLMCDVFHCIGIQPIDIQKVRKQRKKKRKTSKKTQRSTSRTVPCTPRMRWNESAESVTESTCSFETGSVWSNSDEQSNENPNSQNIFNRDAMMISDSKRLLLQQICDQFERRGNLQLIFPRIHNIKKYKSLHLNATNNDHLLWNFLSLSTEQKQNILQPNENIKHSLSSLLMDTPKCRQMETTSSNTTVTTASLTGNTSVNESIGSSQSPELVNECSHMHKKQKGKKIKKKKKHCSKPKKKKMKQRPKVTKPKVFQFATMKRYNIRSRRSSNASTSTTSSLYQSPKRVAFPISTKNIRLVDDLPFNIS